MGGRPTLRQKKKSLNALHAWVESGVKGMEKFVDCPSRSPSLFSPPSRRCRDFRNGFCRIPFPSADNSNNIVLGFFVSSLPNKG